MSPQTVSEDIQGLLSGISEADILVGIPSFNNAKTIGHVVRAVQAGLARYFPDKKAVLINSDGGSTDGTMEVVQKTAIEDFHSIFVSHQINLMKITTPYHGVPGKGSAFRAVFEIAKNLNVKACAVVDSDLRSITPEWIDLLLRPVIDMGYDYVAPYYLRHKYDGTITNSVIYPMTRALYGKRIRQPIGGDFAFSGQLASFYLSKDVWETDVARYGIDIWMTTTAIANNFRVCQSFLGAKIHDPKDPGADLSAMLYQVVGSTFDLMETYYDVWKDIKASEPVNTFGFRYAVGLEPIEVHIDKMIDRFRLGTKELSGIWGTFMPVDLRGFICNDLSVVPNEKFNLQDDIWVDIINAFALAYHTKKINRQHLLKSLTPLYIGRVASFVIDTWHSNADEVEEKIENLCLSFEKKKNALIDEWDK
ncbi:MAG TPA: glycosyltransferase [Nitrospirae bacterium]|nr:glycosyl transferase family 2 [bacterium BMS3Abin10]GBE39084.1 glycosyl transferase family 2 [bacterium BMS3Bbin08]HDH50181.1 glycosyltransferase [Nitrospirota bacterium]HDK41661.1 glycosyltransferase [Nitrospirota bacterium]HDZ84125.1 glycosyltransferase [Nitrospirota bacterium]